MEQITLECTGNQKLADKAHAGIVSSGDLKALFEPDNDHKLNILIKTSVNGSTSCWQMLFDRIANLQALPSDIS